jgi:hypothetical protein
MRKPDRQKPMRAANAVANKEAQANGFLPGAGLPKTVSGKPNSLL